MTDKNDKREKALERAKSQLREEADKDQLVIKAVKMLDEANGSFQDEFERFKDWYSIYFPELMNELSEDEHILKILSKGGLKREEVKGFESLAEESTGKALQEEDLEMLEKSFEMLKNKQETMDELEDYVEEAMKQNASNISTLLGPLLAARLMSLAGGLEELAKKPASTIQMLGAEKALFRYLRGEGTPPKHGIIFEHEYVNTLPEDKRGKMARFLANKAAMAARVDQYSDKEKGSEYREKAREKYEELKEAE
ncbi:hypothetical protein GKQ38_03410 [Candidatus Nanohaloarchaea archaeon]|nr:hypothetical protein GKQ38_03410 [Candidatus Nanohaloarchaea archaeon]